MREEEEAVLEVLVRPSLPETNKIVKWLSSHQVLERKRKRVCVCVVNEDGWGAKETIRCSGSILETNDSCYSAASLQQTALEKGEKSSSGSSKYSQTIKT